MQSHIPGGAREGQQDVVDRLRRLEEAGTIESVPIEVWGTPVALPTAGCHHDPETEVLEKVAELEASGDQSGHTLEPAFRKRTASSLDPDEMWDEVVIPVICMAVYDGDDLQTVFSCSAPDRVQTVKECLKRGRTRPTPRLARIGSHWV